MNLDPVALNVSQLPASIGLDDPSRRALGRTRRADARDWTGFGTATHLAFAVASRAALGGFHEVVAPAAPVDGEPS